MVVAPAGILALGLGVLLQLYVAGVNYSTNAPEGYNPVADAKVRAMVAAAAGCLSDQLAPCSSISPASLAQAQHAVQRAELAPALQLQGCCLHG